MHARGHQQQHTPLHTWKARACAAAAHAQEERVLEFYCKNCDYVERSDPSEWCVRAWVLGLWLGWAKLGCGGLDARLALRQHAHHPQPPRGTCCWRACPTSAWS